MKRGMVTKEGFTLAGFVKLTVVLTLVLTLLMLALPVAFEQSSAPFTTEHAAEESVADFSQPPREAERR